MRHHRRQGSSAWQLRSDDEEESGRVAERKSAGVPKRPSLGLMPLPTIETVMERLSIRDTEIHSGRSGARMSEDTQAAQPMYRTVIHVPKPPELLRREALDAVLLKRILRQRAGEEEERDDDNPDVTVYDCNDRESAANAIDETLLGTSPSPSFYTSTSARSSYTSFSSSSSSPSGDTPSGPIVAPSPFSPADSTIALPPTSAYPSAPSSPLSTLIHHPLSPASSPTWKPQPLSLIPSIDLGDALFDDSDDEMDWDWSLNGGEVVYGAAGLAVSPRMMTGGERRMCCHCQCGMDADTDMELYIIEEESEGQSEAAEG